MWFVLSLLLLATAAHCDERIVNGEVVTTTSLAPWQASLQKYGSHFCGGSIVSSTHVMTACHCKNTPTDVRMGTLNRYSGGVLIRAAAFTCHEQYNSRLIDYDYAFITLSSPVKFETDVIEAIQIAGKEYPGGTDAVTTGWGRLFGSGPSPDQLQVAHTKLLSQEVCRMDWTIVTDRMQCAGGVGNGVCSGDSGGPLVVYENGVPKLVGNTSWAASSCTTDLASAWSKNVAVKEWITAGTGISIE